MPDEPAPAADDAAAAQAVGGRPSGDVATGASRCPRCGARMGRLASDEAPASGAAGRYCGCCGLVVPDAR